MSQQDFASRLQMAPASISSIFNGRTNPTINHVNAIHRAFPQVNTKWLIFGEGAMMSEDSSGSDAPLTEESGNGGDFSSGDIIIEAGSDSGKGQPSLFNQPRTSYGVPTERQRTTPPAPGREHGRESKNDVVNNFDIRPRKVKEIRVFYDDNTYESFTPQSK